MLQLLWFHPICLIHFFSGKHEFLNNLLPFPLVDSAFFPEFYVILCLWFMFLAKWHTKSTNADLYNFTYSYFNNSIYFLAKWFKSLFTDCLELKTQKPIGPITIQTNRQSNCLQFAMFSLHVLKLMCGVFGFGCLQLFFVCVLTPYSLWEGEWNEYWLSVNVWIQRNCTGD